MTANKPDIIDTDQERDVKILKEVLKPKNFKRVAIVGTIWLVIISVVLIAFFYFGGVDLIKAIIPEVKK